MRYVSRYFLILWLTAIHSLAIAQQQTDSTETLFNKFDLAGKGYGGLQIGFSQFNNAPIMLYSLEGGVVVNKKVLVGLEIGGIHSNHIFDIYFDRYDEYYYAVLKGFYGGLKIEPILKANKVLHVSFPVTLGGGKVYYMTDRKWTTGGSDKMKRKEIDSDPYFYAEPGIKLECNISTYMRFGVALSYRFVPNLDLNDTPEDGFSGLTTKIGFFFGKF